MFFTVIRDLQVRETLVSDSCFYPGLASGSSPVGRSPVPNTMHPGLSLLSYSGSRGELVQEGEAGDQVVEAIESGGDEVLRVVGGGGPPRRIRWDVWFIHTTRVRGKHGSVHFIRRDVRLFHATCGRRRLQPVHSGRRDVRLVHFFTRSGRERSRPIHRVQWDVRRVHSAGSGERHWRIHCCRSRACCGGSVDDGGRRRGLFRRVHCPCSGCLRRHVWLVRLRKGRQTSRHDACGNERVRRHVWCAGSHCSDSVRWHV
mmetsp:Transcript_3145/g.7451  ORF Transcript_3145/g.7451 Transcript_3145/m.7451 type:complete len:258 (-) Transcript_3145:479-1252(-)